MPFFMLAMAELGLTGIVEARIVTTAVECRQVEAFHNEMRTSGVDWQVVCYGVAVHGFTNTEAGNDQSRGVAYNGKADRRSWKAMQTFFDEIFGKRPLPEGKEAALSLWCPASHA